MGNVVIGEFDRVQCIQLIRCRTLRWSGFCYAVIHRKIAKSVQADMSGKNSNQAYNQRHIQRRSHTFISHIRNKDAQVVAWQ